MIFPKQALKLMALMALVAINFPLQAEQPLLDIDKVISPTELNADFDAFVQGYFTLHPAPYDHADPQEIANTIELIKSKIDQPMTTIAAWRVFSLLNPVLHDAHAGIVVPKRKEIIQQRLIRGKRILPLELYIDSDDRLFVKDAFDAEVSIKPGTEILAINDRTSTDIVGQMRRHRTGDNRKHQQELLSRWFSEEYWALFGEAPTYKIAFSANNLTKTVTLAGSDKLPPNKQPNRPFDSLFSYKLLDSHTAYLRIETFKKTYLKEFLAFTEQAFSQMNQSQVKNLIIDISDNGGGSNSNWQKGVMPYIADKPYRYASSYRARVTKANASPGEVVGSVVSGQFDKMTQPKLDNPLRFKGNVYVLIGSMTYSSAIQFAATVQDNDIAKIIGTVSGGRAGTTGNVTDITLKHTGLDAFAPVILFSRPSAKDDKFAIQPDIVVPYNPLNLPSALTQFVSALPAVEVGR